MQSQIVKYYTAGLMPNGSMALKFLVEDPLLIGYGFNRVKPKNNFAGNRSGTSLAFKFKTQINLEIKEYDYIL